LHYHGLDEEEEKILLATADELDAHEELKWANDFIAEDYLSAFNRSRDYFQKVIGVLSKEQKLHYLQAVWEDNYKKGYLTEMETTAMLNLAEDWNIEKDILKLVKY
jgi:predicted RNA-binding protein (virulence factor B family)